MPFSRLLVSFLRWRDTAIAHGHHERLGFVFGALTLLVVLAISAALMPFVNIHAGGVPTIAVIVINMPGVLAAAVPGDLWEGLGAVMLMCVCNFLAYSYGWAQWSRGRGALLTETPAERDARLARVIYPPCS